MWFGQSAVQNDPEFVEFDSAVYGIRAIVKILKTYQHDGIDTLQGAIERWAPPSENDTDRYVDAVCLEVGCAPTTPTQLTAIMPQLVKAIIRHENGEQPYTDDQINDAIALA